MENIQNGGQKTIVVYCYRYTWQTRDGKLCVKYVTDVPSGLEAFERALKNDTNIVNAMAEYVNEVNFAFLHYTREVKKEIKEEEEQDYEKVQS